MENLGPIRTPIDAAFPVIPMRRMPEEGRKNPGSDVARQYISDIVSHQEMHARVAGAYAVAALALLVIPGVNIGVVPLVPVALGVIGLHYARILVDDIRIGYHAARYNKARKAQPARV